MVSEQQQEILIRLTGVLKDVERAKDSIKEILVELKDTSDSNSNRSVGETQESPRSN